MKFILLASGLALFLGAGAYWYFSQGLKTLTEFHQFTGSWTGSGKSYSGPNQTGEQWTSVAAYRGAYDDVMVDKREIIETGTGVPITTFSLLA